MKILRFSPALMAFAGLTMLAACGGGGGGSGPSVPSQPAPPPATATPTSAPTATPTPAAVTVSANPAIKYYASDASTSGTTGKLGPDNNGASSMNAIGGVKCDLVSDSATDQTLHIHSFIGVLDNGNAYAFPAGIGMYKPTGFTSTFTPGATNCLYNLHTHDQSGLIHVEFPSSDVSNGVGPTFTVGDFLKVWQDSEGMSYSTTAGVGSNLTGAVTAYVGTASSKDPSTGDAMVTSYTQQLVDPTTITLTSHEAVWLTIGSIPAAGIPTVEFGTVQ